MRAPWICSFLFAFILIFPSIHAQSDYVSTANLSTTWTNNESSIPSQNFTDGSRIRFILFGGDQFGCGFFCSGTCTSYLFAIFIHLSPYYKDPAEVIWSANRDNLVREGAILNLTAAGDLVLKDVDGSIVWTTNTSGKSTAGLNLAEEGNLKLFDVHNSTVWQSFDHPTDSLVTGQKLFPGQKLIPSVSSTDWRAQKDLFSLWVTNNGLFLYVGSNPPQVYDTSFMDNTSYVTLNKSEGFRIFSSTVTNDIHGWFPIGETPEFPPYYIKLMPDGHLKAFGGYLPNGRLLVADILTVYNCYPLSCGRNGICSGLDDQQCICPMSSRSPGTDYFKPVDIHQPNKGCIPITPLTCNATQDQHFIEVKITPFTYNAHMEDVNVETCKQTCLNDCSCKAAIFTYPVLKDHH